MKLSAEEIDAILRAKHDAPQDRPQPFFVGEVVEEASTDVRTDPQPSMWQDEADRPWLIKLYAWGIVGAVVVSELITRCSPR